MSALFLCYFSFVGTAMPYLSLYLSARGLSIEAIALLVSLPQMMRIGGPLLWGWLADHSGRSATILKASALAAMAGVVAMGLAGESFALTFAALVWLFFATTAQMPIGESMALASAGGDAGIYGRIRAWGSIGFIGAVTGVGVLLDRFGAASLPLWMGLATCALIVATFGVHTRPAIRVASAGASLRRRLREPAIVCFLVASFMMIFAHGAFYGFFSLFLERAGYTKTAIGVVWAVGVIAEIALFRWQRPLFVRFDAMTLLSASLLAATLRFGLLGGWGAGWVIVVVTQLLHALTFGLHHSATMALLHRWFEPAQQARAQAVYTTVGYGFGGVTGGLVAGWAWSAVSPETAFLVAAAAALGGWIAIFVARRLPVSGKRTEEQA